MRLTRRISHWLIGLALLHGASLGMTPAYAADSRLDDAYAHLDRAAALLESAAQSVPNPDAAKRSRRAAKLVHQAQLQVMQARAAADRRPSGSAPSPSNGLRLPVRKAVRR